jgi:hypothetical protein
LALPFGLECVERVHNIDHFPKPIRDASASFPLALPAF